MPTTLTRTVLPLALGCALLGGCSSLSSSFAQADTAGGNARVPDAGALPAQTTETQTKTDSTLPQTPVVDTQQITRSATLTVAAADSSLTTTVIVAERVIFWVSTTGVFGRVPSVFVWVSVVWAGSAPASGTRALPPAVSAWEVELLKLEHPPRRAQASARGRTVRVNDGMFVLSACEHCEDVRRAQSVDRVAVGSTSQP